MDFTYKIIERCISCAICGILYVCMHEGWIWRLILPPKSLVCVFDKLTDLSSDEESSIWLSTTLAATPLKFIESVGLIHSYVSTDANLGNQCGLHEFEGCGSKRVRQPNRGLLVLPGCEASAIQRAEGFGLYGALVKITSLHNMVPYV